jgi:hypothetical protein
MFRAVSILVFACVITGCKPTWEDYSKEEDKFVQAYLTGNVATAKAALLEKEKLIARHEAAGNKGLDVKAARLGTYARLCAVNEWMGLTNEARVYFDKVIALKDNTNAVTMSEVIAAIERSDRETQPKWRQQK